MNFINPETNLVGAVKQLQHMLATCYQDAIPETETEESREETKTNTNKQKHMDFVLLSDDEHSKLIGKFGVTGTAIYIENLNDYIGSKGKKYKSHYHTILSWDRKNNPTPAKAAEVEHIQQEHNIIQWEAEMRPWLLTASIHDIRSNGHIMGMLKIPAFRTWAEGVNDVVKEEV